MIKSQYIFVNMGQEDSRPLSHKPSPRNVNYSLASSLKAATARPAPPRRVECEGVLKLQATPFKNCIEIETETEVLFLESVEVTLRQLLEGRLNTNKLFLAEDVERLIEGASFALAHLQAHGVTYKDIDPENIFYDDGAFKLLPNELISLNSYQKLREGAPVLPSPELIIALRCGEQQVVDEDILEKSNVFTLGMLLLEVCTLLPGEECYDSENYDILDAVINERVLLVEEYYGERIAKIVANMLDYDYSERMNLRDLSIWVNRQLTTKAEPQSHPPHAQPHPTHELMNASRSVVASKVERNEPTRQANSAVEKSRKLPRNNSVYMNAAKEEVGREERNKIYINDTSREEPPPRGFTRGMGNQHYRAEAVEKPVERFGFNQSLNESDTYKLNDSLSLPQRQPHPYQLSDDYKPQPQPPKRDTFDRALLDRDTVTKRITKEPARPFRQEEEKRERGALRDVGNQFYPSIEEILKTKPDLMKNIKGPGENGSVSRIKEEIEKNKRLIEQIKRNEVRPA